MTVNSATADGTAVAGTDYTQTAGTLTFPAGVASESVAVPITTVMTGGPTRTFALNLSAPVSATVADGQGVGSILNRQTKFFVVDSGTVKTYEYGSGGTSEEITVPYSANGNTAPRGVATTAAGTTVWVADANKNVHVYDNRGFLLGSWAAGGLSPHAPLAGIATDGTDLWLVDGSADKVYKYAGAASRRSGSQNAASSFALNRSDTNPADVVTDGTSLWVVDDGTGADKVHKYTLSGTLLGSWIIDPADAHPTGLTINPANVSDIWVVDNGTDKVYQYVGAAGRTSGSQNAAATFALNPSDTNPQGLADPPPADTPLSTGAALLALNVPPAAAFSAVPAGDVAAAPSPALRDAVFALLARESRPGTPALNVPAGGALTPRRDSPLRAGPAAGQQPLDAWPSLTPESGRGFCSKRSAVGLLDDPSFDEDGPTSAPAPDFFSAGLAEDALPQE